MSNPQWLHVHFSMKYILLQEEEKRLANVIAKKEDDKRKELGKITHLKVLRKALFIRYLSCFNQKGFV